MIGDVSRAEHIYIVCGYTDMRKAIDGLAAIVQQNFQLDVFSGSLFLFCGKRCDRIKALLCDYFAPWNAPIRNKENGNPNQGTHQSAARNALPDEVISE